MELAKSLLEGYKLLLALADRARAIDQRVFSHIEEVAEKLAATLTDLRTRGCSILKARGFENVVLKG